jgi:hypothetical protein
LSQSAMEAATQIGETMIHVTRYATFSTYGGAA